MDKDKQISLTAEEKMEPMIFDEPNPLPFDPSSGLQKAMDFDVKTKSNEEKLYILLYKLTENEDEIYNSIYSICIGRTGAYSDIKSKLISGLDIDVHKSIIITETKQTESSTGDRKYFLLPLDECISIYAFCIQMAEYFSDDSFNIEEYNTTLIDSDSEQSQLYEDKKESIIPKKYTNEELEYKRMLEESMHRDKFLSALQLEKNIENNI